MQQAETRHPLRVASKLNKSVHRGRPELPNYPGWLNRMFSGKVKMKRKILMLAVVLVVSLGIIDRGSALSAELVASTGWEQEVFEHDLDLVDNIAIGPRGELYVSLESPTQGRVLRLRGGERLVVADKLDRPGGLLLRSSFLYITEDGEEGRVIRLDLRDSSQTVLAVLEAPEGIVVLPDGGLAVAEEVGGRVSRITESGQTEILAEGLHHPEGLAVSADGTIYVAEKKNGRVLAISSTGISVVVEGLNNPHQVKFAPDGSLWISEEAKPGRLLRYASGRLEVVLVGLMSAQMKFAPDGSLWISEDAKPGRLLRYASGRLEVVLVGLMGAQGIAFGWEREVYVAEQMRDRILVLRRTYPDLHPRLRRCSFVPRLRGSPPSWNGCAYDTLRAWDDRF